VFFEKIKDFEQKYPKKAAMPLNTIIFAIKFREPNVKTQKRKEQSKAHKG